MIQSLKRMNLFKVNNERTENHIKQQKIITYVYLILLIGMNIFTVDVFVFDKDRNIFITSD